MPEFLPCMKEIYKLIYPVYFFPVTLSFISGVSVKNLEEQKEFFFSLLDTCVEMCGDTSMMAWGREESTQRPLCYVGSVARMLSFLNHKIGNYLIGLLEPQIE